MKTHLKYINEYGAHIMQTEYEYTHSTACGYVRENVTTDKSKVDCFYCLRSESMKDNQEYSVNARELIQFLIQERETARKEKDWVKLDTVLNELRELGVVVNDGKIND